MTIEEMFETNGGRTEVLNGEEWHVTTDAKGRSVIGPRRRAAPRVGRLTRLKWAVMARFYDEQWHKAVQHLGVDIMIWSMGMSVAAVFIRGAWWVVAL